MRVGLTGGIASGKSTVARRFAELGVPVLDADISARRVVEPGKPGLEEIFRRFGASVRRPDGALDRAALRAIVFNDPDARRELEEILHPRIRADMEEAAATVTYPYLVMAIPLLVEGGGSRTRVDRVLVVDIPEEVQISRLLERDRGSRAQAQAIIASQAKRDARLAVADDVLDNTGSEADLRHAVDRLHRQYLQIGARTDAQVN